MQMALPGRDYYLKESSESELRAYQNYMTNVAVLMGADPGLASEEFNRVILLEKQLANVRRVCRDLSMKIRSTVAPPDCRSRYQKQIGTTPRQFTGN